MLEPGGNVLRKSSAMVAPYTYQALPVSSVEKASVTGCCCAATPAAPTTSASRTAIMMRIDLMVSSPLWRALFEDEARAVRVLEVQRALRTRARLQRGRVRRGAARGRPLRDGTGAGLRRHELERGRPHGETCARRLQIRALHVTPGRAEDVGIPAPHFRHVVDGDGDGADAGHAVFVRAL